MVSDRCPWCMELTYDADVCPRCGHKRSTYMPEPHQLPPGVRLKNRYLVGKVLGEGGFGITYVGWDETLERRVAIKEYFPLGVATRSVGVGNEPISLVTGATDTFADGRNRFLEEARVMARFSGHRALVGVTDYFKANGTAYIIMEFVEGMSLGTYAETHGGTIAFKELMQILEPVFGGLTELHAAGLVHRDISPDNIMVASDGTRLIDFGCAREYIGGESGEGARPMTVMLKYDYAAPEQYGKSGQGPWTDVYALSATIYYCLTGSVPPRAMERLNGEDLVRVSDWGVSIPAAADEAIVRGLEPQSDRRYRSVEELHAGLLSECAEGTHAHRLKRPMAGPILIGALLVMALAVGGFVLFGGSGSASVPTTRADETVVEQMPLELTFDSVRFAMDQVCAGEQHTAVIDADGNVQATTVLEKDNDYGQCDVSGMRDIVKVAAGSYHTVAVDATGHVEAVGQNRSGQCDVSKWNVTSVACGNFHTVGLRADGTVVATGSNTHGQCDVEDWRGIVAIAAGDGHTVGLRGDGTVVATGYDEQGQCDVEDWTDIVAIAAGMSATFGVRSDGSVVATKIKDDSKEIDCGQTDVGDWTDIVAVAAGRLHTVGLRSDGTLVACGSDKSGRCNVEDWQGVRAVSAGSDHTVALISDGSVKAVGLYRDGQTNVVNMSWKANG